MTEYAADDMAAIAARLKEIQAERTKGIQGTPEPTAPAAPSTNTGSGGGFKTPSGGAYDPYCGC